MAKQTRAPRPSAFVPAAASAPRLSACDKIATQVRKHSELIIAVAYIAAAFLTFGKVFAANYREMHDAVVGVPSFVAAALWPIYWPCHLCIWLFS